MLAPMLWLAAAAFAIGTESFMIAGMLPELASDLGVGIETAGQLVTVFALSYALGSPILSALLGEVDRKKLLIAALGVFALSNLFAAFATNFSVLMLARIVMALSAGLFMPAANAVAVTLAGPEHRGRAIAIVTGGLTIAVALGVPIGTGVATLSDWRLPFLLVAAVAGLVLIGLCFGLPGNLPRGASTLRERFSVGRRPEVLLALATTMLWMTGAFTLYTYIAPFLATHAGISGTVLSLALVVFGVGSAIGNQIGGRATDRFGSFPTLAAVLLGLIASLGGFSVLALTPPTSTTPILAMLLLVAWGIAGWAGNPAQAARLVGLAPQTAVVALSLNASALYLGIAAGSVLGSLTLRFGALWELGLVGALCEVGALLLLWLAWRERRAGATAAASRA